MEGLTPDVIGLLEKRAYDMAACATRGTKVYLNGEKYASIVLKTLFYSTTMKNLNSFTLSLTKDGKLVLYSIQIVV